MNKKIIPFLIATLIFAASACKPKTTPQSLAGKWTVYDDTMEEFVPWSITFSPDGNFEIDLFKGKGTFTIAEETLTLHTESNSMGQLKEPRKWSLKIVSVDAESLHLLNLDGGEALKFKKSLGGTAEKVATDVTESIGNSLKTLVTIEREFKEMVEDLKADKPHPYAERILGKWKLTKCFDKEYAPIEVKPRTITFASDGKFTDSLGKSGEYGFDFSKIPDEPDVELLYLINDSTKEIMGIIEFTENQLIVWGKAQEQVYERVPEAK